jgi:cytidine deaminase
MISTITLQTVVKVYDHDYELSPEDQQLLQKARETCHSAYAPYSNFHVGAAILLDNGIIITGSNQENLAYPSGLCAERTAIFYTGANHGDKTIKAIAVAAYQPLFSKYMPANPCGACRQAMLEYENKQQQPIRIILEGEKNKIYVIDSIDCLLPLRFKAEFMGLVE